MTTRATTFGALALVLVSIGCAGPAGNVSVLQSSAAVTPGATVAWAPLSHDEMRNGDPRIDNDITRQRIRLSIETALVARGHRFVQNTSAAKYLVAYHVGLQDRQDLRTDSVAPTGVVCGWRGCVGGYGWGMYGPPSVRTVDYTEGTMLLDLTERSSGALIWRATSHRRIDEGDGSQERLNEAVFDMTRALP